MNIKSDNASVIKPAKLVVNDTRSFNLVPAKPPTTTASYIRPATLKYSNKNSETNLSQNMVHDKKGVQKDNAINILRATPTQQNISTLLLPTITQTKAPKLITVPNVKLKKQASLVTHNGNDVPIRVRIKDESINNSLPPRPKLWNKPLSVPTQTKLNNVLPIGVKAPDKLVNGYIPTTLPSSSVKLISNTRE